MTKKEVEQTVGRLENPLTEKIDERSKLNYEVTHIRETIDLVKKSEVKK